MAAVPEPHSGASPSDAPAFGDATPTSGERIPATTSSPTAGDTGLPGPANPTYKVLGLLVLTPWDEVVVLDFHAASLGREPDKPALLGTTGQTAKAQAADRRADLDALVRAVYHLLSGRPVSPRNAALRSVIAQIASEPARPGDPLGERPDDLSAAVAKLIAINPAKLYPTAAQVAGALAPFVARSAEREISEDRASAAPVPLPRGRGRLMPALVRGAALAAIVLVGSLILLASRGLRLPVFERPNQPEGTADAQKEGLDALDPAAIPMAERFAWQPEQLVAVLGEHRQRHWQWVTGVALSPDGQLAASVADDNFLRIWDPATMRELAAARGPDGSWSARCVAIAPDGKTLVTGHSSDSGALQVWDWDGTTLTPGAVLVEGRGDVRSVAFAPFSETMIAASGEQVRLWSFSGAKFRLQAVRGSQQGGVNSVAFGPDGLSFVSGGEDGLIRVWDSIGGTPIERAVLRGHTKPITAVAFSPDGRTVVAGARQSNARAWDIAGAAPQAQGELSATSNDTNAFAFSGDGTRLVSTAWATLQLWDAKEAPPRPLTAATSLHNHTIATAALSADGKNLLTGGDCSVRRWDVTGKVLREHSPLAGHTDLVYAVAFSPDGRKLASASGEGLLRVWDPLALVGTAGFTEQQMSGLYCAAFSPDGRVLATGGLSERVVLLNLVDGVSKRMAALTTRGSAISLAFHPTRKVLAAATDAKVIHLWDFGVDPPREWAKLEHPAGFNGIAMSPDGETLAAGCGDRQVRLWDVSGSAPREIRALAGHAGWVATVAFSPDGKTLASGSVDGVRLWDPATGASLKQYAKPKRFTWGTFRSLAFAADGASIFAAHEYGAVVRLGAAGETEELCALPGMIRCLALAPDGRHLATGNGNGTVYILRLSSK